MPSPVTVSRHFATIRGTRQVHYRRAGSGPPLLMLHQSPGSSREFLPLIAELAGEYTVIAPDTPGNGLSQPLSAEASMEDYATAVVDFMDEIGLERTLVYGFHTGAACTLELARRHASRLIAGVANGYTQLNPAEREDILAHFLPPFAPEWTGAHLLWAWARIREQYLFFPWHRHTAEARLATGLPRVEQIHAAVMDLLRAGDHYRYAYRAAFAYDRVAALREVQAQLLIMTAQTDALYPYLQRMPEPPPAVRVARPAHYAEAKALLRDALAAGMARAEARAAADGPAVTVIAACDNSAPVAANTAIADATAAVTKAAMPVGPAVTANTPLDGLAPAAAGVTTSESTTLPATGASSGAPKPIPNGLRAAAAPRPIHGTLWSDLLPVTGRFLYALRSTEGSGTPVVMCHDTAGSCLALAPVLQALLGKRPLLAVDLPGNGESDNVLAGEVTVANQARFLESAILGAGYAAIDVLAQGGGAVVAAELASAAGVRVRRLAIWETPGPTLQSLSDTELERYAPLIIPNEYGTHLIEIWNRVRDQMLFAPRHAHRRDNVRCPPDWQMQPQTLHVRAFDALKCLDILHELHRAHARYPLHRTLTTLTCPVRALDCDLDAAAAAAAALEFFDSTG